MPVDALPTLSPEGFTTNKAIIMTKLYEYFLVSDYSQSNTFFGEIASLKYILGEAKDSNELKDMCTAALEKMYSRYYQTVTIDVIISDTPSKYSISVNIIAVDYDGKTYKLNEQVRTSNNNIVTMDTEQEALYV